MKKKMTEEEIKQLLDKEIDIKNLAQFIGHESKNSTLSYASIGKIGNLPNKFKDISYDEIPDEFKAKVLEWVKNFLTKHGYEKEFEFIRKSPFGKVIELQVTLQKIDENRICKKQQIELDSDSSIMTAIEEIFPLIE